MLGHFRSEKPISYPQSQKNVASFHCFWAPGTSFGVGKALQKKKKNKVEFLLSLTIQCNEQTPVLARGVTYQQEEHL